jgi:predicted thioesterase
MHEIKVGITGEETLVVTPDIAISFLGLEDGRVLSTPNMILYMERVSRNTLFKLLESGFDSVGTKVNIEHLKAAPLGATVVFSTEIIGVDDRRIMFAVAAKWGDEFVGQGTHERTIINVAKFAARLAEKKNK